MAESDRRLRGAVFLAACGLFAVGTTGEWVPGVLDMWYEGYREVHPLSPAPSIMYGWPGVVPTDAVVVCFALAVVAVVRRRSWIAAAGLATLGLVIAWIPLHVLAQAEILVASTPWIADSTPVHLSVAGWSFVVAGLLFAVLGGLIRRAWIDRNVPAAAEPTTIRGRRLRT